MELPGIVEAALGLVFIYFLVGVLCSGITEFIAQERGRRGKFLREGMINIVADRWFYLRLINHPLVSSLYRDRPGKPATPSYIPADNFASALLDTVLLKASQLDPQLDTRDNRLRTFAEVRAAALKCKEAGYTVGDALLPLLDSAQGDLDRAYKNIAAWYEHGMERVTGWYKKYARRFLLVVGLLTAVLFNIDTLQIATQLSQSAALRKSLADAATEVVATNRFNGVALQTNDGEVKIALEDLRKFASGIAAHEQQGLPFGFSCIAPQKGPDVDNDIVSVIRNCWNQVKSQTAGDWFLKLLGWLITGLAISLGAPFWFELMNKLVDLRGAGKKPVPAGESVNR